MPGYHLYELTDPSVDALAKRLTADGVILGVHLQAEDQRMQNPLAKVPPLPLTEVVALAERHPKLRVIAFGVARPAEAGFLLPEGAIKQLADRPELPHKASLPDNVWIELSFFEFESSFATALKLFPVERLLFGTHTPLFYARANILKIKNSEAPESAKTAVLAENAQKLLGVQL